MKPFFQLRLWMRNGPTSERILIGAVAVLVLCLAAWAAVPNLPKGASTSIATGPVTAGPGGNSSGPASGAGGAQALQRQTTLGTTGGAATPTGGGGSNIPSAAGTGVTSNGTRSAPAVSNCGTLTKTDTGVTASTISVGVLVADVGQADSLIGIPSLSDQEKFWNGLFDSYNKTGGVQCRKLVPTYYSDNIIDSTQEQSMCLQVQQDGVFAVLDNPYTPQEINCLVQRQIPDVFFTQPHSQTVKQYWPYVLSAQADYDRLIRDYVFGANQRNLLAGQRIGVIEQTCYPDENTDIESDLAALKIPIASTYNDGCPSPEPTPDQSQAAALQFKGAQVTTVLSTDRRAVTGFAQAAQGQQFQPKYVLMNDNEMPAFQDSSTPVPSSLDGTVIITTTQDGADYTPGGAFSPATAQCAQIAAATGEAPPDDRHQAAGSLDGSACAVLKLFVQAAEHDTPLVRKGLANGLVPAGYLDMSGPGTGPMQVTNSANPTGGEWWRPAEWHATCSCWQVLDFAWQKSFS